MNTVKVDSKTTKMIAHRGVSGLECENTIAAFVAAGNRSYFGIETDVHVTADGKFAIFHDDNTKRVSGQDYVIESASYDVLSEIPLYDKAENVFRSDLFIPQLHEYIRVCRRYEKTAVLELKNLMTPEAIKGIVEVIGQEEYLENTIFISFAWDNLVEIRKLSPKQEVQFLIGEYNDELIKKLIDNSFDLDILYTSVTRELVDILHQNGLKINCWTCDTKEEAEKLVSFGVDFITSNILE